MSYKPIPNWKTNIIAWQKVSEKTASLMLEQCELALDQTIETADSISTRADKLLTIALSIFIAIVAYLAGINWNQPISFLSKLALITLLFLSISLIFCYRNLRAYTIAVPGDYPNRIVRSEFIDTDFDEEEQYINLCLSICENIQRKIDHNIILNAKRMRNNTWALRIICALPVVLFILFLAFRVHHF